jgi:hypothetical protein
MRYKFVKSWASFTCGSMHFALNKVPAAWSGARPLKSIRHTYGNAYLTLSIASADSASDDFLHPFLKGGYLLKPWKCALDGLLPYSAPQQLAEAKAESPCVSRG